MIKNIFTKRMLNKFAKYFFICLGIISSIIQILTFSFPDLQNYRWKGLLFTIFISGIVALIKVWPKDSFSESFSNPDVKIGIKVGNIFDQVGHLVIGFSDTFDTEVGDVISNTSLQGQFLMSMYGNNKMKLDSDLEALLQNEESTEDMTKTRGKNKRYKIGTVVALNGQNRKFFCCAYSNMGSDLKATSDINNLWLALQNLWVKIRKEGEQKTVVLPVIGTNLARVSGISYKLPIDLILLSFIINSRVEPISKELVLMIKEEDKDKINMIEMQDFLKSLHN